MFARTNYVIRERQRRAGLGRSADDSDPAVPLIAALLSLVHSVSALVWVVPLACRSPAVVSVTDEALGTLAKVVTTDKPYEWREGRWEAGSGYGRVDDARFHVVAYDYGIKRNILRCLVDLGCRVTVLPESASADDVLRHRPDGVFLSNGPGDPAAVTYGVSAIRGLLDQVPIFGICLGHQILGLAVGGQTYKLKFGHRGANHPVKDLTTGKVEITSQNHGFMVDTATLPQGVYESHVSLFDGTNEGIAVEGRPARVGEGADRLQARMPDLREVAEGPVVLKQPAGQLAEDVAGDRYLGQLGRHAVQLSGGPVVGAFDRARRGVRVSRRLSPQSRRYLPSRDKRAGTGSQHRRAGPRARASRAASGGRRDRRSRGRAG